MSIYSGCLWKKIEIDVDLSAKDKKARRKYA
jgi:hypothetical protein